MAGMSLAFLLFTFSFAFEAQPKQKGGKQRHKPAIAILLVGGPLETEVAAENEPEQPESGEEEDRGEQRAGNVEQCDAAFSGESRIQRGENSSNAAVC